jgi:hypothetical protein
MPTSGGLSSGPRLSDANAIVTPMSTTPGIHEPGSTPALCGAPRVPTKEAW